MTRAYLLMLCRDGESVAAEFPDGLPCIFLQRKEAETYAGLLLTERHYIAQDMEKVTFDIVDADAYFSRAFVDRVLRDLKATTA